MSGPICAVLGELAGIYLLGHISWDKIPLIPVGLAGGAMLVFLLCIRQRELFIICFFAAVGSVLFFFHTQDSMQAWFAYQERYVHVTGRIAEVPYERDGQRYYIIKAERLEYGEQEMDGGQLIRVSSEEVFEWNDTVEAAGFLETFQDKMNDSGFDSAVYYNARGIHYKMYADEIKLSNEEIRNYSLRTLLIYWQNMLCRNIEMRYDENAAGILKTIVTGNFRYMQKDISKRMVKAGVRRYLHSPHIHMLFLLGIFAPLRKRISKNTAGLMLGIIMILYAAAQSGTPVFLRTFLFAGIGMLVNHFTGIQNKMDNWGITILACGLVNPVLYIEPGFVMSSIGHFFYLLFYENSEQKTQAWLWKRGIKAAKYKGLRTVVRTLGVSFLFAAALLPIAAYYFNGYSVLGSVLGIIYIPAVLVINMLLAAATIISAIFPSAIYVGILLEQCAAKLVTFLLKLACPFYLPLPKPSILFLGCYYTALAAVYFVMKKRRDTYLISAVSVGMAIVLIGGVFQSRDMQVSFVNVGQGDAAVVTMPDKKRILIDAGGTLPFSDYNYGEAELIPYLQDEGIWEVDYAVVSHYHADHAGGMLPVLENVKVKELFLPDRTPEDAIRKELEDAALRNHTKITYIGENCRYDFGKNSGIEFICPPQGIREVSDANEASLVVRIWYGAFSGLFTGDITADNEMNLLNRESIKNCDVLKVPHHGSGTSSSEEFIEAVAPVLAYIGVGADNVYNLPDPDVVARYEKRQIHVFRADASGTVTVRGNEQGMKSVRTYR